MQEFYLALNEPVWCWDSEHVGNAALKRNMELLKSTSRSLYHRRGPTVKFHSDVQDIIDKPMLLFVNDVQRIQPHYSASLIIASLSIRNNPPHELPSLLGFAVIPRQSRLIRYRLPSNLRLHYI